MWDCLSQFACCLRDHTHVLGLNRPVSQEMEITANELKNVLNKVISKRKSAPTLTFNLFTCCPKRHTIRVPLKDRSDPLPLSLSVSVDQELNTEGFSLETCRSMIALMDVSFVSRASGPLCYWWRNHSLLGRRWDALQPLSTRL